MSEDCKKCNVAVPLIAHELEMAKREAKERKLLAAVISLVFLLIVTNAYHIINFLF